MQDAKLSCMSKHTHERFNTPSSWHFAGEDEAVNPESGMKPDGILVRWANDTGILVITRLGTKFVLQKITLGGTTTLYHGYELMEAVRIANARITSKEGFPRL